MTNPSDALRGSVAGNARLLTDDDVDTLTAGSDGSWDDDDDTEIEPDEIEDDDETEDESEDDE